MAAMRTRLDSDEEPLFETRQKLLDRKKQLANKLHLMSNIGEIENFFMMNTVQNVDKILLEQILIDDLKYLTDPIRYVHAIEIFLKYKKDVENFWQLFFKEFEKHIEYCRLNEFFDNPDVTKERFEINLMAILKIILQYLRPNLDLQERFFKDYYQSLLDRQKMRKLHYRRTYASETKISLEAVILELIKFYPFHMSVLAKLPNFSNYKNFGL
jgi:hypothetical protein